MKKSTNKYVVAQVIIILCLQLTSCNYFEKKSNAKPIDNCILLVDSMSNSAKIKEIPNVQNLEILNGIKGFQFGMSSKLLRECITLEKLDNQFSLGIYQNPFSFQGIEWPTVLLTFKNDKLIGIELNGKVKNKTGQVFDKVPVLYYGTADDGSPYILHKNFTTLLGNPNYKALTIVEKDLNKKLLYMTYNYTDKKPIRENLSTLLKNMSQTLKESPNKLIIDLSLNELTKNLENRDKPQAVKVQLEYYNSLKLSSSWESSHFLRIDYARQRFVDTPAPQTRKYNGNTVAAYSNCDYEDTWDINISMFVDRSLFDSIIRIREQNILQKTKGKTQKENIENTKRIIDGF